MSKINLNFLSTPKAIDKIGIESILHQVGKEIRDYATGYFEYIVTCTSMHGETIDATLYILVPEIGYDYRLLYLHLEDVKTVQVTYFTLKANSNEVFNVDISDGYSKIYDRISEILSTELSNQIFKFLVSQVDTKRENENVT